MDIRLYNETIEAIISTMGAELIHLIHREDGKDYMWSGDAKWWTGRSPVLFPIVGSLNGGSIKIDGQTYTMKNHGFARKSEFVCTHQDKHTATFRLDENLETLKQYPYNFLLELTYTLIGTAVSISYKVSNTNEKLMYFQLGTHPAFTIPTGNSHQLEDWALHFEKKETLSRIGLQDNLLDLENVQLIMDETDVLPLSPEQFYLGAIVFKAVESSHVTLKSDKTPETINVSFSGFPDMGIWQPKDAPFLCIEPWAGHGDPVGFDGDISEKIGMISLEPGKTYSAELRIRL